MSSGKSLATRIRQRVHSRKQQLYYDLGIRKRGYSPAFLRAQEQDIAKMKPAPLLFRWTFKEATVAFRHLFEPGKTRVLVPEGRLYAKVKRKNGTVEDLGLISKRVITDTFVNYLVDQLQSSTGGIASFRFHAAGISSSAEDKTNTTLGSEVSSRGTGTQTEGATANIYQTVGTVNFTAAFAIVEHGLFRASSGDVLADRSVFGAINVGNGDGIEFTYELELPAGN